MRSSVTALAFAAVVCGTNGARDCTAQDAAGALLRDAVDGGRATQASAADTAIELYESGRFAESIPWFDQALETDPHNESLITARLIARRKAGQLTPDEQDLLNVLNEEKKARIELVVRAVHLRTLQARGLLLRGRHTEAMIIANELIEKVNRLPEGADRDALIGPLREIADLATGRRTAVQRSEAPRRYLPGRRSRTVDETIARDTERLIEQGDIRRGYKSDEAEQLTDVDRSRRIPSGLMTYPDDWLDITERRKQYADGLLYKGKPFRGKDGQMRYTAVYDLRDLLTVAPDFLDSPEMDLAVVVRNAADRYALQWRSPIFAGYAEDLAAGAPLLQFFGGLDESRVPPSRTAADARYQEILGLVHDVLSAGADGN